jgi:hypothetical protein
VDGYGPERISVLALPPQHELAPSDTVIIYSQPLRQCQLTGAEVLRTGMGRSRSV